MRISGSHLDGVDSLSEWLSARGWTVLEAGDGESEVLLPWDRDEFTAALLLRMEIAAWGSTAEDTAEIRIDADRWPRLTPPAALVRR